MLYCILTPAFAWKICFMYSRIMFAVSCSSFLYFSPKLFSSSMYFCVFKFVLDRNLKALLLDVLIMFLMLNIFTYVLANCDILAIISGGRSSLFISYFTSLDRSSIIFWITIMSPNLQVMLNVHCDIFAQYI